MSKKCSGCLNEILNRERLQCFKCHHWYDLECANVPLTVLKCMSSDSRNLWTCPGCRILLPKGDNTNDPARPEQQGRNINKANKSSPGTPELDSSTSPRDTRSSTPPSDLATDDEDTPITRRFLKDIIAREIGNSLYNLAQEQRHLRELVDSFQQTISFFSNKYEELRVALNDKTVTVNKLEKENCSLQESVSNLTKRINQSEQYARASNIEIQCVPENRSENLIDSVLQLSKEIKCDIVDSDIQHITRVAKKNTESSRPRSILIKFNSPRQRDSFLASAIKYNRNHPQNRLNSNHLGASAAKPDPIFVVEHLSAENKSLHAASRARAKELGYKFVWVRNGRIFLKKSEESVRITVDSIGKLQSLQ